MAGQGFWTGLQQTSGTALNTAVNFMQLQSTARHQRALESESTQRLALDQQRLNIAEETGIQQRDLIGVQKRAAEAELAQKTKDTELIAIPDQLNRAGIRPELHDKFIKYAGAYVEPGVTGTPMIQRNYARTILEKAKSDFTFQLEVDKEAAILYMNDAVKLGQELTELRETGNAKPEAIASKEKQYFAALDERTKYENSYSRLRRAEEAKIEKKLTSAYDEAAKTWRWYDQTGQEQVEMRGQMPEGAHKEVNKPPPVQNKDYVTPEGLPVIIDMNNPVEKARVTTERLIPYEKPPKEAQAPEAIRTFEIQTYGKEVPELRGTPAYKAEFAEYDKRKQPAVKPDYTPKAAMSRISAIDSAIARLKTTGMVDTATAIQNPLLAGLVDTKDPEAVKQAILSLESERAEVTKYAPKGYGIKKEGAKGILPPAKMNAANMVRENFKAGKITEEEALKQLRNLGMQ